MIPLQSTFTIELVHCDEEDLSCFDCIGSIDANAAPALNHASSQATTSQVVLNFKQVKRVNSMGLSLLLKLFQEWESLGKNIEVTHLNRMTSMLFKITGLGRFIQHNAGKGVNKPTDSLSKKIEIRIADPGLQATIQAKNNPKPTVSPNATLKFIADLQSGQQLSGWYLLNTYLQRRLGCAIHLEQPKFGEVLSYQSSSLLFSKPFDACSMIKSQGFVPLMRPMEEADEVVILSRSEDHRDIHQLSQPQVVTASKSTFVYILGRSLCDEFGMDSSDFKFQFAGNEIKALQMLLRERADLLFMLKKTHDGLSSFARKSIRIVYESTTNFAYHLFCCAPYLGDLQESLIEALENMSADPNGRKVLEDIQFEGWCKPEQGELDMLMMLFDQYDLK